MSNVAAGKDTDDEGESLNDVETTLNSLGITLRKSQNEWRSFEEVLDEVASKWNIFEDTEQSKIATAIAGVRQQENFRALMNNWDTVRELTKVSETSMGSATEKMEIYLDSVEAKTKEVQAAWEEFIIGLNQSDSYKGFLDFVIFLIDNLPTVVTLLGSMLISWKAFSVANHLKTSAIAMREMLTLAINTETIAKELSAAATAKENVVETQSVTIKSYKSAQLSALIAAKKAEALATQTNTIATQTETTATEANTIAEQTNATAETTNNIAKEQSVQKRTIKRAVTIQSTAAENKDTAATNLNTTATKTSIVADEQKIQKTITLKTVMAGLATVIGVVTAAISIASIGIMAYQNYIQGLQDTVTETTQKIDALQEEIDDLDDVIDKYDEVIKSSGSATEQKESLTKLQEQLISTYGEEAKALDLVNGKYEDQIDILKNLQKEKLAQQVQEYTNSQGDRDKLLHTSTTNLVLSDGDAEWYEKYYYELLDEVGRIVRENGGTFGKNLDGDYGIWATGETQPQIYEALLEYQKRLIEQGDKDNAKRIADMLNRTEFGFASMKEDYDKFKDASNQEKQKDLAQFQLDNFDDFQDYKDLLQQRNDLYKEYTEAQTEEEKKQILAQMEDISKKALEKKQVLYDAINKSNINGLAETFEDFFAEYDLNSVFKTDPTALSYFDDLVEKAGKTTTAGRNIAAFGQQLDALDEKFETGQITAQEYFGGINEQIDKIDLNKVDSLYGSVENFNTMLASVSANTADYIGNIMNAFGSGNMDDFDFFDNLTAAISNISKITDTIINLDKAGTYKAQDGNNFDYDYFNEQVYGKEGHLKVSTEIEYTDADGNKIETDANGNPVIKPTYKNTYYDFDYGEAEEEVKSLMSEADSITEKIAHLKSMGFDDDDKTIKKYEAELDVINNQIKELTDGVAGLDDEVNDVKDAVNEINSFDLKGLDKAYEILDQAFADGTLTNSVDRTLDQVDSSIKDSAIKMATFLKQQVESTNAAYQESAKGALDAMGLMSDASVEEIATAIIQTNTNLNAAATASNQIASTAMGKTIQQLGQMLIKLADVMDGFEISIPIKIPMIKLDLANFKNGGALFTASDRDLIETEIKIGASSTIRSIGEMLSNADIADGIGSLFTPIEADVKTKTNGGAGGYSPSGGGKGGSNSYSAEDAASDLKDILQDIESYEADIELDLEDQTEQYINQEMLAANRLDRLKEELDYYNDIYDVTEETSKWLETQNKLLDNQSKKVGKLQNANDSISAQKDKLIKQNSQYDIESWFDSEGNDTLAYGDLINSFEYKKNAIEQDTAARMRAVYNSVAGSTNKDTIQAAKDKIKQIEEEGDIKIKALEKEQEKVENIHDSVGELNEAWMDNQDAIREALAELHDIVIGIRDELTDDIMEQLERAVDKTNESIEKDVTRMEQLVTIQEKYNDILNETIDTQDELDSELQASLDSFEYLDEQMRQLMFNEDDYKVLSETLTGIQTDIAEIWEDHYNQINSLTEDEMYKAEYITNETERQLEMKMKEYELAKAELDVAKARTNLQNVQNERNVRMFVGGQWIWTADPNAVKDAQQQLADAEREKNKIEREAEQQTLIDEMNQIIDSDNLQIDKNNELLERIQEAIELETQEVKNISDALSNAQGEDLPALNDVLQGAFGSDGGDFSTLLTEIGENSTELVELLKGTTTKEAEALLKGGTLSKKDFESLISKLGYGWDEKTGTVTTQDGSFKANYKGWKADTSKNTPLGTADNGASVTGNGKTTTNTSPSNNAGGYPKQGTVSTGSLPLRIRAGAGLNYKVLGTMPKGASVTITGEANSGWAKVQYKGINGYASKQYLTYDQGGLATGKGIFLKDINVPERVLSPQQTKSFDTLVKNLTTNPVLAALTKNIKGTSSFNGIGQGVGETKQYYFSNFTVQADNITEFIDSLEGMIPISGK